MPHLALGALLCGCATAPPPLPPVPAGQVAALEASVTAGRAGADGQLRLAAAYLQAGRFTESASLLEPLLVRDPDPPVSAYMLALSYEGLDRPADARAQYQTVLEHGASPAITRRVRRRIVALERLELERAVQTALASEDTRTPEPQTVGVFPFLTDSGSAFAPFSRALAELLTDDLKQTARLRVVERAQVQRVLDEIQLTTKGAVDDATAARAGRILAAGRLIQGRLDGSDAELRMQVQVATAGAQPAAPLTEQGSVGRIMAMQNNLALSIFENLGIQLTIAERERVLREPTQNVQALLAFGFGLEAEDRGRPAEAVPHYRTAVQLDPAFAEAATALERARARADAAGDSPESMLADGAREFAPDLLRMFYRISGVEIVLPTLGHRDPLAEVLGTEGFQRRGLLDLLIRRPQ